MTDRLLIVTMLFLLAFSPSGLEAADLRSIVNLRGDWSFTVGDDMDWAKPETDISDWDHLPVPKDWENYYWGYNGYAWYRKSFDFDNPDNIKTLVLLLGYIDDVDEVYVNGNLVGKSGKFPPNFQTAWNIERRYYISSDILKPKDNVICVRVYDTAKSGGIARGDRIGLYYNRDQELLDLDLSGEWKFSSDYERGVKEADFDDRQWENIFVPSDWDSQGYSNFDGTAWYRKRFSLPEHLIDEDLVLILGRIDDFDKVYLNGSLIGQVEELPNYSRFRRENAWRLFRAYQIPGKILRSKNVIVVEVEDTHNVGGIYEGPIGIMREDKAKALARKYDREQQNSGWESFLNDLFNLLD